MTLFARLRSFVAALVAGRRLEREMDEEWRFHLDARREALVTQELSREAAERQARREFGDPRRWKEGPRGSRQACTDTARSGNCQRRGQAGKAPRIRHTGA